MSNTITKTVVLPPAMAANLANSTELTWLRLCAQEIIPFFCELNSCEEKRIDQKGVVVEIKYTVTS